MSDLYKTIFKERIKEARKMTGFTQEEVSKITGITRTKIAKYETGQSEPTLETLGTLSNFYGVSIDWLLGLGKQVGNKPNYDTTNPEEIKKIIAK